MWDVWYKDFWSLKSLKSPHKKISLSPPALGAHVFLNGPLEDVHSTWGEFLWLQFHLSAWMPIVLLPLYRYTPFKLPYLTPFCVHFKKIAPRDFFYLS
jgi:hypothetical protein